MLFTKFSLIAYSLDFDKGGNFKNDTKICYEITLQNETKLV